MKRLDDYAAVERQLAKTDLSGILFPEELSAWEGISPEDREKQLRHKCAEPLRFGWAAHNLYMRLKWIRAFEQIGPPANFKLVELGAGAGTIIPECTYLFCKRRGKGLPEYATLNMNEALTAAFKEKSARLPIKIEVIGCDAVNISERVEKGSVDLVVLEHSVNDMLQAFIAERSGIDTTRGEWMKMLPEMVRLVTGEYTAGRFDGTFGSYFKKLFANCAAALKSGGVVAATHFMYGNDLDLGYDPELYQNMIPLARKWFDATDGGSEFSLEGFDPQWWLFWRKS